MLGITCKNGLEVGKDWESGSREGDNSYLKRRRGKQNKIEQTEFKKDNERPQGVEQAPSGAAFERARTGSTIKLEALSNTKFHEWRSKIRTNST